MICRAADYQRILYRVTKSSKNKPRKYYFNAWLAIWPIWTKSRKWRFFRRMSSWADSLDEYFAELMLIMACSEWRSGVAATMPNDEQLCSRRCQLISTHRCKVVSFVDHWAIRRRGCGKLYILEFVAVPNNWNACFAELPKILALKFLCSWW